MKSLDQGYSVAIDTVSKDDWHEMMCQFSDASFYQTWSYGVARSGRARVAFAVLRRDGIPVAMAQVRVHRPLGLRMGVAYVNSGPMWRRKGDSVNLAVLRNMVRSLYNEYVLRRNCFLTIAPRIIQSDSAESLAGVYMENGFERRDERGRTVFLDLSPPLDEIRNNLSRNWRRNLRKGETAKVEIVDCTDDSTHAGVLNIEREKQDRKRYHADTARTILEVNKDLPTALKPKLLLCKVDGHPAATLGWSTIGNVGTPLLFATGTSGLGLGLSNLLYWKMIEYYKNNGFVGIDLAGVGAMNQQGVFYFKTQVLGKAFVEPDRYVGYFEACESLSSRLLYRSLCRARESWLAIQERLGSGASPEDRRAPKHEAGGGSVD
jgi:hypothetical protein